jgi:hypothetical protein
MLKYTKTPIEENLLFVKKGVDGIFTEFPHLTFSVYQELARES